MNAASLLISGRTMHDENISSSTVTGLHQNHTALRISTNGQGFFLLNRQINEWLNQIKFDSGLLTLFVCHTSASLTIQENADPDVQSDLMDALDRLAPQGVHYRHNCEGPDDMPAHIRSMVTSTSLNVPVHNGKMVLGTWQGIYLIEHRQNPQTRMIALHIIGSK